MGLLLALFLSTASAEEPPKSSVEGQSLGSVHALIQRSLRDALDWSPNAKLYSIHGAGPKSGVLFEEWTLTYGDPVTRDGFYAVKFGDGIIQERHVCRGDKVVREYYWEGKLRNTLQGSPASMGGHVTNLPLGSDFLDSTSLDSLLKARGYKHPQGERWTLELSRLSEPKRDAAFEERTPAVFLLEGTFRPIGPIPNSGRGQAMWMVDNGDEVLFLEAASGRLINARPPTSKAPMTKDVWKIRR